MDRFIKACRKSGIRERWYGSEVGTEAMYRKVIGVGAVCVSSSFFTLSACEHIFI